MNRSKCPACGSTHTKKNGIRNGVQTYKCCECGYQFRNERIPSGDVIWKIYQVKKQTISELSTLFSTSESTIKRRLKDVSKEWVQPSLDGSGYVHLDATYWGHNWGVLLGIDDETGRPLYLAFIRSETTADFRDAVRSIESRGYHIKGIIIDGRQSLFKEFSTYNIQMCQFHMKQIVKRYLTNNPRLNCARELKDIMETLSYSTENDFVSKYQKWKSNWECTLNRRTMLKSGKMTYTHKRLRSAMHSVDFFLPYLFTYQKPDCVGMPNTNNKIEGIFTDLKKNLNNHSGLSLMNRKRFICGFFLAWEYYRINKK